MIGQIIDGKYRTEEVIGRGGMGVVVRAQHLLLRQTVAIKIPHAELRGHADLVERGLREARAAAHLKSDHVCRVLDVGLLDGLPYIVMEMMDGEDLAAVLKRRGRLSAAAAVAVMLEVCDALGEAHALGMVHRDVKPQNLFLARRGDRAPVVKVLDFGIAKMNDPKLMGDPSLTNTSALLGSPSYIAPEQFASTRDVDGRADVWALGVCLYQCLTGALPFVGDGLMDLAVRIATHAPRPPRQLEPSIPPALEQVVLHCLEKDAARRIGTVGELVDALVRAVPSSSMAELSPNAPSHAPSSGPLSSEEAFAATAFGAPPNMSESARTVLDAQAAAQAGSQAGWARAPSLPLRSGEHDTRSGGGGFRMAIGALLGVGLLAGGAFGISRWLHEEPPHASAPPVAPAPASAAASAVYDVVDAAVAMPAASATATSAGENAAAAPSTSTRTRTRGPKPRPGATGAGNGNGDEMPRVR